MDYNQYLKHSIYWENNPRILYREVSGFLGYIDWQYFCGTPSEKNLAPLISGQVLGGTNVSPTSRNEMNESKTHREKYQRYGATFANHSCLVFVPCKIKKVA